MPELDQFRFDYGTPHERRVSRLTSPPLFLPEPFVTGLSQAERDGMSGHAARHRDRANAAATNIGGGAGSSTEIMSASASSRAAAGASDESEVIDLTEGYSPPTRAASTQTSAQVPAPAQARAQSSNRHGNSSGAYVTRTDRAARRRDRAPQPYADAIDLDAEPDVARTSMAAADLGLGLTAEQVRELQTDEMLASPWFRGVQRDHGRLQHQLAVHYDARARQLPRRDRATESPTERHDQGNERNRASRVMETAIGRMMQDGIRYVLPSMPGLGGGGIWPTLRQAHFGQGAAANGHRHHGAGGGGGVGDRGRFFQPPNMDYERGFAHPPLMYEGGFLGAAAAGIDRLLPVQRKYTPPEPCKEPFTRTFTQADTLVCPQCRSELGGTAPIAPASADAGDADEPAQSGKTAEEEMKRRIFVTKCGHVYCGACATHFKQVFATGRGKGVRCQAPDCGQSLTKTRLFEAFV